MIKRITESKSTSKTVGDGPKAERFHDLQVIRRFRHSVLTLAPESLSGRGS